MKPLLLLLLVFLTHAVRAADLVFGFYAAPVTLFTKAEASTMPATGKADLVPLLKARGFDMPEGSSAWFDAPGAEVFLRSTQRDLNHFERLLDDAALAANVNGQVKQVKVTAICHAIPLSALPADFGPGSSLKSLPQDKLTVIDRATLLCRGGQRSKMENRREKTDKPPPPPADGDAEWVPPEAEREFEIEITVGEDGTTVDLNMAWDLKTPKLAPPGERGEFKLTTQILSTHNGSVMQELGVTGEAEPRLVFLTIQFYVMPPVVPVRAAEPPK